MFKGLKDSCRINFTAPGGGMGLIWWSFINARGAPLIGVGPRGRSLQGRWNLVSFDKILTVKSKKICLLVVLILACLVHPISSPRCIKQCINKPIKSWWIHLLSNCKEVADRLFALKGTNSKISKKFPISDVVIQKLQQVHD